MAKNKAKIVFVNGVFDIIHPGHIKLLRFARSLGDKLIVGLNSDRAVRRLKGPNRPINNQKDRKLFIESLGIADKVVIFNESRTGKVVRKVRADIVVRGSKSEHTPEETRRIDGLPKHVEVIRFNKVGNFSTTNTVKKVIQKR
ncbi:adenylyltransferase/cytidyltransferase family protein [Candidatus Parcubacteria bacterium]|nr:adenylyltransferase/cytidyltransferase family protein [Candidatus Parcubacteria bacterium]